MSANRIRFEGLDELKQALRDLPDTLITQAGEIVVNYATQAEHEIAHGYPVGKTGNLQRRVSLEKNLTRAQVIAKVVSKAPHANIFENGTVKRTTEKGYNRGRMPQPPESERMIPKAIRWRRRMTEALMEFVREHGFEVSE